MAALAFTTLALVIGFLMFCMAAAFALATLAFPALAFATFTFAGFALVFGFLVTAFAFATFTFTALAFSLGCREVVTGRQGLGRESGICRR